MVRVLVILLGAVLAGWALADAIQTPPNQVRALPKAAWLVLVLVPFLGGLAWFAVGRSDEVAPTPRRARTPRGPIGPDDDPEFLRRLGGGHKPD
jgi:hypothetical protein